MSFTPSFFSDEALIAFPKPHRAYICQTNISMPNPEIQWNGSVADHTFIQLLQVKRMGWRGLWMTKNIEGTVDDDIAAKLAIGEGRQVYSCDSHYKFVRWRHTLFLCLRTRNALHTISRGDFVALAASAPHLDCLFAGIYTLRRGKSGNRHRSRVI